MAYTKTTWANELPSEPIRYDILEDDNTPLYEDVQINLASSVVAGTPVNAANLNKIEDGIEAAHTDLAAHEAAAAPHTGHALTANGVTNGNSHDHVGGDGAPIGAGGLADGAVNTTAKLANNIVDDTKVGARVTQLYRRQGGNASNWATPGTTSYTPARVREQVGAVQWTGTAAFQGTVDITFPVAFSGTPIVQVQAFFSGSTEYFVVHPGDITGSGFRIYWRTFTGLTRTAVELSWRAIGPE
jgi:hypothetical protein